MINRLRTCFPNHNIVSEDSSQLFIADYKKVNGGTAVISSVEPEIGSVKINNENRVQVYFDGFPDNSFVISPGNHCKQCECIIFPQSCNNDDWILVIETKYTSSLEVAFRENVDYPNCMIDQIIDTVNFLRDKGVIEPRRRVSAIVSFPTLIADFSATFFTGTRSMEDILFNEHIQIRATNSARIRSNKNIRLST